MQLQGFTIPSRCLGVKRKVLSLIMMEYCKVRRVTAGILINMKLGVSQNIGTKGCLLYT